MLGLTSLLALIGLIIVVISTILLITRRNKNLAVVSFIMGLVLIFIPGTLIYLLLN